MMIAGKKTLHFSGCIQVRIDPGLRVALAAAAERQRLSMSELVRRGVRAALCNEDARLSSPEQRVA